MRRPGALIALALLVGCEHNPDFIAEESAPIIGGQPSSASDYPSSGALLVHASFMGSELASMICTGTLIAPDVVLTAAHCTADLFGPGPVVDYNFSFTLDVSAYGMTTTSLPPLTTHVVRLLPHPLYDLNAGSPPGLSDAHDVGLLFLEQAVVGVTPAVISDAADDSYIVPPATVHIAGYGQRTPNGMEGGVKYHADSLINEVNAAEMQIGDVSPVPQKCHGDSGGPTYLDVPDGRFPMQRLIGVTSRAYDESDCNRGGVDTRADFYRGWIDQEMRAACNDGTRPASQCAGGGGLAAPGGAPADAGIRDASAPDAPAFPDAQGGSDGQPHADATTLPDAGPGADAAEAGDAGRTDSGSTGGGGGSGRARDSGCDCSSTSEQSLWPALALVVLALVRARVRG